MNKKTAVSIAAAVGVAASLYYISDQVCKKMIRRTSHEEGSVQLNDYKVVRIRNRDSKILTGYYASSNSDTVMIILHPFGLDGFDMISYVDYFKARLPYNMLIVDLASHGRSDGNTVQVGKQNYMDLFDWIDYVKSEGYHNIILYGKEMGANIILNTSPVLERDESIKCIISDGAFTDMPSIMKERMFKDYHVVRYPFYPIIQLIFSFKYHIKLKDYNTVERLENTTLPVLFVHARNDRFVSFKHVFPLYNAKEGKKDMVVLKDQMYLYEYTDVNEPYYNTIFDFIHEVMD